VIDGKGSTTLATTLQHFKNLRGNTMDTLVKVNVNSTRTFEIIDDATGVPHLINVKSNGDYLLIQPEGYGDNYSEDGDGYPILIESHDGKIRAHIWSDINEGDPTHVISLHKAKESNRGINNPNFCHNCGLNFQDVDWIDVPSKDACPNCGEPIKR
jgi:predicted Zn-ribbon and HTH transcriptional regulator